MQIAKSVLLRNRSPAFFMYRTADAIVGTVHGSNSIEGVDFNHCGAFEAHLKDVLLIFKHQLLDILINVYTIYNSWGLF